MNTPVPEDTHIITPTVKRTACTHPRASLILCSHLLQHTTDCTEGLRHTQRDASGKSSHCRSHHQISAAVHTEMSTRGHVIVCVADRSGTGHDVMVTRVPWHSFMQHNITMEPQADIRPCAPRQLPSHWLNKHSQRDLGKQLRCLTIGWSGVLLPSY